MCHGSWTNNLCDIWFLFYIKYIQIFDHQTGCGSSPQPGAQRLRSRSWGDLQNKQNPPIAECLSSIFIFDHVPRTIRNHFFFFFEFQLPTWKRPKVGSDDESTDLSSSLSIRNLKMTDVNDVKKVTCDISWCRGWTCSNFQTTCDDMCCQWCHFSVLQPLQFVVLLATFTAAASESGTHHRSDFFVLKFVLFLPFWHRVSALLVQNHVGPPLNSIYHHPFSMRLEHHDFVALLWQTLYTKKLQNQARLRLKTNWGVMGPKDWDWTRWKIATWAAQEHETNREADSNFKYKEIRFVALSAQNGCRMLPPRTRFGRCKKSSVWWGWRPPCRTTSISESVVGHW